ncbi:ATP-binding protein [Streptomyces durmitorensis]|uniref:histidine kinase n=1 Tax=Streptomyces durmitorensis TaxID=319947 RepID=A0ABY4Q879_9ACTN|nr:ATP-binding protein [Streptomyces durmitorensis]UQT61901.1 ATP-binding protein [Streptomyces durmitorensis]
MLAALDAAAEWRQVLAGGCAAVAVLLIAWVLVLVRQLSAERAERARQERVAAVREAEVTHLAGVRLPAIAERVRAGQRLEGVPGPLAPPGETGEEFARALAAVAVALGSDEAVRRERGLRDSVQAAFESVARTMHAMATVQQQVLDRVERSIDDPHLMGEVMKADHAAAQMTRKAQTLLVMCGIWPARRETRPVSLYDCVRGAQSRIVEYSRIEVHGGQTLYAVPPAVEGLMHAIAELLENATVFSPSRSHVVVTIREVGAGAVLEIDDAGLGMPPDVLHRAMGQLRDDQDLARLGAVPRLGLACVGRWSRELGFNVELSGASAYGGTRAVTFVPFRLLTEPPSHLTGSHRVSAQMAAAPGQAAEHEPPVGLPARQPTASGGAPEHGGAPVHEQHDPAEHVELSARAAAPGTPPVSETVAGLPRRRNRRQAGPAAARRPVPPPSQAPPAAPAAPWTPEAARASIASVVSGSLRGRAALDADRAPAPDANPSAQPPQTVTPSQPPTPDEQDGGRQ